MNAAFLLMKSTLKALVLVLGLIITITLFIAVVILAQIPSKERIRGCMTTEMFHVELCPGSASYVPLRNISKNLQQAVVLTEDSAFYQHRGFDFQEIQRSFEKNLQQGRLARGGSTISQQLAKNLFLSSEKSFQRKLFEAIITVQIEKSLNKREILERYLNVVQFGPNLFGVKAAAQFYFKKSPAQLDLIESAYLAFLLPSPEKYSVSFFKKHLTPFARKRIRQITENMYRYQRVDSETYNTAIARLDSFLSGGPAVQAPEGLDLDAPEESADSEDANTELTIVPPPVEVAPESDSLEQ